MTFSNPLNWDFLNESLGRWFIFFIAMSCFAAAWGMILRHMQAVA